MSKWGYDFDGVLCEAPSMKSKLTWGKMNGVQRNRHQAKLLKHYGSANALLIPDQRRFHIITARRDKEKVKQVTKNWLSENMPSSKRVKLHMLNTGRTLKNVINFKASVIKERRLKHYVEDNKKVLKGLSSKKLKVKLWYFDGTAMSPFFN